MSANRFLNFNDGEGLEYTDLNDITSALSKAQGDGLHYGSAAATANINPDQYSQQYDTDVYQQVFCQGWAGAIKTNGSNLQIVIQPGLLGAGIAADGGSGASPHALDDFVSSTIWWQQPTLAITLAANASGSTRYDLVTVALTGYETTGDTETRDFEDATTGALTTTTPAKRRRVAPVIAITAGTPGAGIPATPAGTAAIAAIAVPTGATSLLAENVRDFCLPLRHGVEYYTTLGFQALTNTADWGADSVDAGGDVDISSSGAGGRQAIFYPPAVACSPLARLLGVIISHESDDASDVEIIRNPLYNSGGSQDTLALVALGTTDTQPRSVLSEAWTDSDGDLPIWLNGFSSGRAIELRDGLAGLGPRGRSSVALMVVTTTADVAQINAVTWIVAR